MSKERRRFSLTIRSKLILTNALLLVLLGGSLWYLRVSIGHSGAAVAAQRAVLERLESANAALKSFGEFRYWLTDLAVSQLNESEQLAEQAGAALAQHLKALEVSEAERVARVRRHMDEISKNMLEAAKAYQEDNRVLGNSLVAHSRPSAEAASALIQAILSGQQGEAKKAGEAVLATGQQSRRLSLVLLGIAIATGVCLTWLSVRAVTRPIANTMSAAQALAEGDLTAQVEVTGQDEMSMMGHALNKAIGQIEAMVREVHNAVAHVTSASQQLSAAGEQLSNGAQEQASSLEETAASMEQMTSTVKQSADNAKQANQLAISSRDAAEKGGKVVGDAVAAMAEINKSSKQIADIISVIDEIAFQTNLLALNAAVEAARAGEQGRGFAVVAAEVRSLAQRSATSAKEIKSLIQDSVQKVQDGSELVNHSGKTLEEIVTSVKKVAEIVSEIAAAAQEQAAGIDQVNKAITQMDQVTQSNAAQVEELSSTSQSLAAQAQQLQELVGRFKIEEGQGGAARPSAAEPASAPTARAAVVRRHARPKAAPVRKAEPALAGSRADNGKGDGFEEF